MLTAFDKQLLNLIQNNLPLESRPFTCLARQLGTDESRVLERLSVLREHGYIRHIGPFFDSTRLGYVGTLVALRVSPEKLETVARQINSYIGVTHNYEREGSFNLWFTLLSPSREEQQRTLAEVEAFDGVEKLLNLPSTKKFKVNVRFTLD
ncbi:AsnC family transcriptional regulator [Acetonema longum]|uniref:siroheme decarboxylase n=1 Tax=Acetonema longum DSM 6540 TaxID=1009370 RepID=F7NHK9_9FIRM|nr:AsnC family transcriptional regulator [Acetonema longum]EGO64384.1 putative transcriptional regulator, AsnC family protein [Acetonema longum DSM 6540]